MPCRVLALVAVALVIACSGDAAPTGAELQDRLLAPCCFRQTLADHESPVATALRGEIRERLAAGELAVAIEQDLVERHGAAIRAQGGGDRRWLIGLGAGGAVLASLGLGLALLRSRRSRVPEVPLAPAPADDRYADQLDDELATSLD